MNYNQPTSLQARASHPAKTPRLIDIISNFNGSISSLTGEGVGTRSTNLPVCDNFYYSCKASDSEKRDVSKNQQSQHSISSITFIRNGMFLLMGCDRAVLCTYNADSAGEFVHLFNMMKGDNLPAITALCSNDNGLIYAGSDSGHLFLVNNAIRRKQSIENPKNGRCNCISYYSPKNFLAVGHSLNTISLWNSSINEGTFTPLCEILTHKTEHESEAAIVDKTLIGKGIVSANFHPYLPIIASSSMSSNVDLQDIRVPGLNNSYVITHAIGEDFSSASIYDNFKVFSSSDLSMENVKSSYKVPTLRYRFAKKGVDCSFSSFHHSGNLLVVGLGSAEETKNGGQKAESQATTSIPGIDEFVQHSRNTYSLNETTSKEHPFWLIVLDLRARTPSDSVYAKYPLPALPRTICWHPICRNCFAVGDNDGNIIFFDISMLVSTQSRGRNVTNRYNSSRGWDSSKFGSYDPNDSKIRVFASKSDFDDYVNDASGMLRKDSKGRKALQNKIKEFADAVIKMTKFTDEEEEEERDKMKRSRSNDSYINLGKMTKDSERIFNDYRTSEKIAKDVLRVSNNNIKRSRSRNSFSEVKSDLFELELSETESSDSSSEEPYIGNTFFKKPKEQRKKKAMIFSRCTGGRSINKLLKYQKNDIQMEEEEKKKQSLGNFMYDNDPMYRVSKIISEEGYHVKADGYINAGLRRYRRNAFGKDYIDASGGGAEGDTVAKVEFGDNEQEKYFATPKDKLRTFSMLNKFTETCPEIGTNTLTEGNCIKILPRYYSSTDVLNELKNKCSKRSDYIKRLEKNEITDEEMDAMNEDVEELEMNHNILCPLGYLKHKSSSNNNNGDKISENAYRKDYILKKFENEEKLLNSIASVGMENSDFCSASALKASMYMNYHITRDPTAAFMSDRLLLRNYNNNNMYNSVNPSAFDTDIKIVENRAKDTIKYKVFQSGTAIQPNGMVYSQNGSLLAFLDYNKENRAEILVYVFANSMINLPTKDVHPSKHDIYHSYSIDAVDPCRDYVQYPDSKYPRGPSVYVTSKTEEMFYDMHLIDAAKQALKNGLSNDQ